MQTAIGVPDGGADLLAGPGLQSRCLKRDVSVYSFFGIGGRSTLHRGSPRIASIAHHEHCRILWLAGSRDQIHHRHNQIRNHSERIRSITEPWELAYRRMVQLHGPIPDLDHRHDRFRDTVVTGERQGSEVRVGERRDGKRFGHHNKTELGDRVTVHAGLENLVKFLQDRMVAVGVRGRCSDRARDIARPEYYPSNVPDRLPEALISGVNGGEVGLHLAIHRHDGRSNADPITRLRQHWMLTVHMRELAVNMLSV